MCFLCVSALSRAYVKTARVLMLNFPDDEAEPALTKLWPPFIYIKGGQSFVNPQVPLDTGPACGGAGVGRRRRDARLPYLRN